jgi:hypothetical protein
MKKWIFLCFGFLWAPMLYAQSADSLAIRRMADQILLQGSCYEDLRILCKQIGHRLSGSAAAAQAVAWGQKTLTQAGADRVWLQPVDVPHWVRGQESLRLSFTADGKWITVPALSLGNAVGTSGKPLTAPVVLVNNLAELRALPPGAAQGKIVFLNYRFKQELVNTFQGYGDAGINRWIGPKEASLQGAAALIIRSLSTGADDVPHTGSTHYADSIKAIPAMAIGNQTADKLAAACQQGVAVKAQMQSACSMAENVRSYNVIGELTGTEYPDEIIVAGGHLDSWDVGEGAHDDGAGCVQAIEIIRTFKALNIRPKRTIRVVLFMNEENGMKGGLAYADSARARNEKHIFALESDAGGFVPRGIGLEMSDAKKTAVQQYAPLLLPYGIYDFSQEEGGVDISPLKKQGVPLAGLLPDPQRYFDVHHTNADVFEAINHRELKLGALGMCALVYLISNYGL